MQPSVFCYRALFCVIALVWLTSCRNNPAALRVRANELFEKGAYEDAELQYRKLLSLEPRDGEAHFRLGLSALKNGKPATAYESLRLADSMLGHREDVSTAFADLLLRSFWHDQRKPKPVYDELARLGAEIISRNPRSYAGNRVIGYLAVLDHQMDACAS